MLIATTGSREVTVLNCFISLDIELKFGRQVKIVAVSITLFYILAVLDVGHIHTSNFIPIKCKICAFSVCTGRDYS